MKPSHGGAVRLVSLLYKKSCQWLVKDGSSFAHSSTSSKSKTSGVQEALSISLTHCSDALCFSARACSKWLSSAGIGWLGHWG